MYCWFHRLWHVYCFDSYWVGWRMYGFKRTMVFCNVQLFFSIYYNIQTGMIRKKYLLKLTLASYKFHESQTCQNVNVSLKHPQIPTKVWKDLEAKVAFSVSTCAIHWKVEPGIKPWSRLTASQLLTAIMTQVSYSKANAVPQNVVL